MDKHLYLTQIKINSFRDYMHDFCIDLPGEPGLTMLVGANGLGKSTILHAIEWGLTGKVERIERSNASLKDKRTAVGFNPHVHLRFNKNITIDRHSELSTEKVKQLEALVREHLTHRDWRNLSDLAASLQFTHFRGQSALQHFSNQDGKERFRRLEGVSRLAQLITVQQKLERKKTSSAFSRVEASLKEQKSKFQERRQNLLQLLDRRETLKSLALADRILTPEDTLAALENLYSNMHKLLSEVPLLSEASIVKKNIPKLLEKSQLDLQMAETKLNFQKEQLQKWFNDSKSYELLAKDRYRIEQYLEKLRIKSDVAIKARDSATRALQKTEKMSVVSQKNLNTLTCRLDRLQQLHRDCQERKQKKLAVQDIQNQLRPIKANHKTKSTAFQKAESEVEHAKKQAKEYQEQLEELDQWQQALFDQNRLVSIKYSIKKLKPVLDNSIEEEKLLTLDEKSTVEHLKQTRDEGINVESQLREARRNAQSIQVAVASIASALSQKDTDCPVCSTSHAPGQLKALAQKTAEQGDSTVNNLEKRLKDINDRIDEFFRYQETLKSRRKAITELHNKAIEFQEVSKKIAKQLNQYEFLSLHHAENFEKIISQGILQRKLHLDYLKKVLISQDKLTTLQKQKFSAFTTLEIEEKQLAHLTNKSMDLGNLIEVLNGNIEVAIDDLSMKKGCLDKLEILVSGCSKDRANAEQIFVESQQLYKVARSTANIKMEIHVELTDAILKARSQLTKTFEDQKNFKERWIGEGYADTPNHKMVEAVNREIKEKIASLGSLQNRHIFLLKTHNAWRKQAELQETEVIIKKLQSTYNVVDLNALQHRFQEEEGNLANRYTKWEQSKNLRKSLTINLQARLDKVREGVFRPLNSALQSFCASLLTGWEYQLIADAVFRKSSAIADLILQTKEGENLLPQLTLSEGQMAAMELSLMFSASETYPWSPWRALLLDDPLQHNDTIHSAAFIDVVRNMIKEQGYQVIITTHDMDEAAYFLRKCRNVGLATQYCHLLSKVGDKMMYEVNS